MTAVKNLGKKIAAAFIIVCCLFAFVSCSSGENLQAESSANAIKTAIMDKALQCYVIEGSYPSGLEYLEDNYGLVVNHNDYQIVYTAVAENLPPQIKVVYKNEQ